MLNLRPLAGLLVDVFAFMVGFMFTFVVLIFVAVPLWAEFIASLVVGMVSLLILRY